MYYNSKDYPKKVKKRIMRHRRIRYHNDAYLFDYENSRKNKRSYRKKIILPDDPQN